MLSTEEIINFAQAQGGGSAVAVGDRGGGGDGPSSTLQIPPNVSFCVCAEAGSESRQPPTKKWICYYLGALIHSPLFLQTSFKFVGAKSRTKEQLQMLMYTDEMDLWIAEARRDEAQGQARIQAAILQDQMNSQQQQQHYYSSHPGQQSQQQQQQGGATGGGPGDGGDEMVDVMDDADDDDVTTIHRRRLPDPTASGSSSVRNSAGGGRNVIV